MLCFWKTLKHTQMLDHYTFTTKWRVLDLYGKGKDIELRVAYPYFQQVKVGDIILIRNQSRGIFRRVIAVHLCVDVVEVLKYFRLERIAPGFTQEYFLRAIAAFLPPQKVVHYGILVFELDDYQFPK